MKKTTRAITFSAAFAALILVATAFFPIPLGHGYANFGDCLVLLAGFCLGPWWGAAAAGVGSALADVLTGFAYYAPVTLVIKSVMALLAGLLFTRRKAAPAILAALLGEMLMMGGYFVFEWALYGAPVAAADLLGNGLQGLFGLVTSLAVLFALVRTGAYDKIGGKKNDTDT